MLDFDIVTQLKLGEERRLSIIERILARCKRVGECWEWQGPTSGDGRGGGYGRFSFEGRTASVHKIMYILFNGPIPTHKQVDHECCNRLCCNPAHLVAVTHLKNQKLRDQRKSQ